MVRLQSADLLELCIQAIEGFVKVRKVQTLDAYADIFVAGKKGLDAEDEMFVKQVLYGCERHKKMIKVVISSFYFKHSHEASLTERTRYTVFSYLIMTRLEELGWPALERLVLSQDLRSMYVFLNYVLSSSNLNNWMKPEWMKIYDEGYIDQELIAGVLQWTEPAGELLQYLEEKAYNVVPKGESSKSLGPTHTVPKPFNITKPKPRMVPPPDSIPCGVKANPAPEKILASTFVPSVQKSIERQLDMNKTELADKYDPALEFKFQTALRVGTNRPEHTQTFFPRAKEAVEAQLAAELKFDGIAKPRRPPTAPTKESAPIKLNTAAILREDAMYRKKQEEEAAMITRYESELRDASEFEAWQRRMTQADEEERLKEINRRRIEMALTAEQAIEARKRKVRENHVAATMQHAEAAVLTEKRKVEIMEEDLEKKLLVDDVQDARAAIEEARVALEKANMERADQIRKEREAGDKLRAERAAEEMARRQDLIRQIRAMENVPKEDVGPKFDPTETAGWMLLDEMSYAELQERMTFNKRREQQLRETKRSDILRAKKEKQDDIANRAQRLGRIRSEASSDGTARRRDRRRKEEEEKLKVRLKSDGMAVTLQKELEHKRRVRKEEDKRLAAELKEISIKKQYLDADFAKVEETKYRELEMGAEREIKARQSLSMEQQATYEATRQREESIRQRNLHVEEAETRAYRKEYTARVDAGLDMSKEREHYRLQYSQHIVDHERHRANLAKAEREALYPYATVKSREDVELGRTYATMKSQKGLAHS